MDMLDLTRGLSSITSGEGAALLSALFAHSPDGMAFIGPLPDLTIRAANEAFARQMRVPLEQMVDRPAEKVIPDWMMHAGSNPARRRTPPLRSRGGPTWV